MYIISDVIQWLPTEKEKSQNLERILWIGASIGKIVVISLLDNKALPLWREVSELDLAISQGLAVRSSYESRQLAIVEEEIAEKHKQMRDKAWEIIGSLVDSNHEPEIYQPTYRGRLIVEASIKHRCKKDTIYKYLRKYWQGGKTINALLPYYENCGAPGKERRSTGKKLGRPRKCLVNDPECVGINVNEEVKRKFRIGVRLYYNNRLERPLTHAYDETIRNLFNVGYREEKGVQIPVLPPANELPTHTQFKYWFTKELDLRKTLKSRKGERDYNLNYLEKLGNSTLEAFGPGSRYQIDANIGDVYLVHRYNRNWIIGKPVIYVIIDVFSRLIAGIYVGLEGPSWLGAMMALANAASDKVRFCAQYGIEISENDWPCHYLPATLTADRGELLGNKPNHLINSLAVDVINLPAYRADWKGIIEQHFNLDNQRYIHWLPGAVRKRIRDRGERDYRLDAKLDLTQFTRLVIECVLYHNNNHRMSWYLRDQFMINDEVEPYPIKLWQWGLKHRGGQLHTLPEDIIRLNLMSSDKATITEHGILFKKMLYSCEKALQEQWFLHARKKTWKLTVSYDPRLTNYIYIRDDRGRSYDKCTLLDTHSRYRDRSFEEVEDLLEYEKFLSIEAQSSGMQNKASLNAIIECVVKEATEMTNAVQNIKISKKEKLEGIRDHRRDEKFCKRVEESWVLGSDNESTSQTESQLIPLPTRSGQANKTILDKDGYIAPPKHIDVLRKIKKGGFNDESW
jgi:putative transposase